MLDLIICSRFKDSQNWHGVETNQVHRYFAQIESQEILKKLNYKIYAMEGCSVDNTREVLESYKGKFPLEVLSEDITGDSPVASTLNPLRLTRLGQIDSVMMEAVRGKSKYVLWTESDLIIPDDLIERLLEGMDRFHVVAPVILRQTGNVFYDTWAFVNPDGTNWDVDGHEKFTDGNRWQPMKSIGSTCMINGQVLEAGANFGNQQFLTFCESVRNLDFTIGVDLETIINHPFKYYIHGRMV